MDFSRRIWLLVLSFIALVLFLLGVGWWAKGLLLDETQYAYNEGVELSEAVDKGRSAQVNFQRQVQEWENVLIRGGDRALYNKYWAGFEKREGLVQSELDELKVMLKKIGGMDREIEFANKIQKEHKILAKKYRAGLSKHEIMTYEAQQTIDVEVRGIDRATSSNFDKLIAAMQEDVTARFHAEEKKVRDRVERNFWVGALGVLLVTALLGIFALWVARRVIDALGTDPETAVSATARIASGDLTQRLNAKDPESLIGSLEMMQSRLRNISLAIREVAFDIQTRAQDVPPSAARDLLLGDVDRLRRAIDRLKISR